MFKKIKSQKTLRTSLWLGLVFVYMVTIAGSIVRSTGSGMGCPDWPQCFGQWVPPTSVDELPTGYQDFYSEYRLNKVAKFSKMLRAFGFEEKALSLENDDSIQEEAPFNSARTWTEYGNRLSGFVAGNVFLFTFILVWLFHRKRKATLWLMTLNLIILGFNAWFGSIVVATNLMPWIITVHMILAIVIIFIHVWLIKKESPEVSTLSVPKLEKWMLYILMLTSVIQLLLGTRVRQAIDFIASDHDLNNRFNWITELGTNYYVHRSFAWTVLIISAFLAFRHYQKKLSGKWGYYIFSIVTLEVLSGVTLGYGGFPALLQPVHLLLSALLLGIIFWTILRIPCKK